MCVCVCVCVSIQRQYLFFQVFVQKTPFLFKLCPFMSVFLDTIRACFFACKFVLRAISRVRNLDLHFLSCLQIKQNTLAAVCVHD